VESCKIKEVIKSQAYILLYTRKNESVEFEELAQALNAAPADESDDEVILNIKSEESDQTEVVQNVLSTMCGVNENNGGASGIKRCISMATDGVMSTEEILERLIENSEEFVSNNNAAESVKDGGSSSLNMFLNPGKTMSNSVEDRPVLLGGGEENIETSDVMMSEVSVVTPEKVVATRTPSPARATIGIESLELLSEIENCQISNQVVKIVHVEPVSLSESSGDLSCAVTNVSEKVVNSPEKPVKSPEKDVKLAETCVKIPEKLVVTPEKLVVTSEKLVVAPEKHVVTPEKIVVTPEKLVVTPEKLEKSPAPEKIVKPVDKIVVTPEKLVKTPEKLLESPEELVETEEIFVTPPNTPTNLLKSPEKLAKSPDNATESPEKMSSPVKQSETLEGLKSSDKTSRSPDKATKQNETTVMYPECSTRIRSRTGSQSDSECDRHTSSSPRTSGGGLPSSWLRKRSAEAEDVPERPYKRRRTSTL
jgi:hypothetical protein